MEIRAVRHGSGSCGYCVAAVIKSVDSELAVHDTKSLSYLGLPSINHVINVEFVTH